MSPTVFPTSPVEIVQVTKYGIWVAVGDHEYFLDYVEYPWFKNRTIEEICDVEMPAREHLYWPRIDVDLCVDCFERSDDYPLVAKEGV